MTKPKNRNGSVHYAAGTKSNMSPAEIEKVLKIIRDDKSAPVVLRLRVGVEKKLADVVFVKKISNGIIEFYVRED